MKCLILVRHAKSSWKKAELADFDRPLNRRGKQDALLLAQRLAARKSRPQLILSSPAKRARKTANQIAWALELPEEQLIWDAAIYQAAPEDLLRIMHAIDDRWEQVLLVGHNPGLTDLGKLLAGRDLAPLPTAGVLCFDVQVSSWRALAPGSGVLNDNDSSPQAPR